MSKSVSTKSAKKKGQTFISRHEVHQSMSEDNFYRECKDLTDKITSDAEEHCQKMWDDLHKKRSKIVKCNIAVASIVSECARIRSMAKTACSAVRSHYSDLIENAHANGYRLNV